ncbi:MAG: single-stranded DNA-binding protein [Brevinematia bacterium]
MPRSFNKVIIVGNLVRDPEVITTAQGKIAVRVRIAVDDSYKDIRKTYFFDATCWERIGEIVGKFTRRGDRILIEGRLVQSRWESRDQNGNKVLRDSVRIIAENVLLLSPKLKEGVPSASESPGETPVSELEKKEEDYKEYLESVGIENEGEAFEDAEIPDESEEFPDEIDENPDYSDLDDSENIKGIDTKKDFEL